jgi:hypothetical protein
MKKLLPLAVLLLGISSLDAQERSNSFNLGFTNIEIFHQEISPAFKINSKVSDSFDFTILYANNFISKSSLKRPKDVENPKAQNLYLSMNYRF